MSTLADCFRIDLHNERMRDSFWYFTEKMFLSKLPNRVPARHQRVICDAVQKLADSDGGILVLLVPPGGAKSLICARSLPAWVFGREPRSRVLAITNTMPLVESHGRAIREAMLTRAYENVFDVTVSGSSSAAAAFLTTGGGEFFGVGSAGATLGRRSEWIVVDDPVASIEEANSLSQMQKLHQAWENNILTRAVPGCKIVVIQQRLSVNDLAGYITANAVPGGYPVTVVRMPMLCDDPANDPLGRAMDEALWPEYWTAPMLAQARADELKWKTLYMQRPASADAEWFNPDDVQAVPLPAKADVMNREKWRILMGCDVAYTEGAGDATVFVVVAFENATGRMHVMDLYREHRGDAQTAEDLLDWMDRWKPSWVGLDKDLATSGYVGHLRVRAVTRNVAVGMLEQLPLKAGGGAGGSSKQQRAVPLKLKAKSGLLCVDRSQPWAAVLLRELFGFPNLTGSAVDDCVDALGIVARKVSMMVVSRPAADQPARLKNPTVQQMTLDGLHEEREHSGRGWRPRI